MYFCLSLPFLKKKYVGFSDRKEVAKAINAENESWERFQVGF
jgi:hypothetical protein